VVADDDLDEAVVPARIDADRDRAGMARVEERIAERFVCCEQDVGDVALRGLPGGQPEPQMRPEQECLRRPRREAKTEPRWVLAGWSGYVDGILRFRIVATESDRLLSAACPPILRAVSLDRGISPDVLRTPLERVIPAAARPVRVPAQATRETNEGTECERHTLKNLAPLAPDPTGWFAT
jgi:hypothetical protein